MTPERPPARPPTVPPGVGAARLRSVGGALALPLGAVVVGQLLAVASGRAAVPVGVLADAVVQGLLLSLFGVGLLLVHRSARFVNFAHGAIAVATSVLALTLVGEGWPWLAAVLVSLLAAAACGGAVEVALVRRFATAPRLVPTVATLGVGQVVLAAAFLLPQWRFGIDLLGGEIAPEALGQLPTTPLDAPFGGSVEWRFAGAVITGDHLVAAVLAVAALVALGLFLQRTRAGTAIRAAAENGERAALLGIGTGSLNTVVWLVAGGLAGLGAILGEGLRDSTLTTLAAGLAPSVLLRGLACAVLGRMESIPRTVTAAVAITAFERCLFWATGRAAVADVVLLLVVGGALLLQRDKLSRTDQGAASTWAAAEEVRTTPDVLRRLQVVQTGRRWAATVLAVAVLGFPWAMSPSQVYIGTTYTIYGLVAISLVVLTGWGGQISLGQFGLVAVGASLGGALTSNVGLPFPIAAVLACGAGAIVAMGLGVPALRIRGLYLAVTTLAFAVAVSTFMLDRSRFGFLVPEQVNRPRLWFIDFQDERAFYYLAVSGLAAAVAATVGLRRTRTGRVLIAMRDNERAAQAVGLSLLRTRLATFGISGFIAAFAGVLLVHQSHALRPESFGPEQSIQMFLMVVIGGLGSVTSALLGAGYMGTATLLIDGALGQLMASGIGVLVVLTLYPRGLGGLVFAARDAWLRRIALREKIFVRSLLGDVRELARERSRAPLSAKPEPAVQYELVSNVRTAGASQRLRGWVYE